jgi:hypothetical protein
MFRLEIVAYTATESVKIFFGDQPSEVGFAIQFPELPLPSFSNSTMMETEGLRRGVNWSDVVIYV